MNELWVTGDIHGQPRRFSSDSFPAGKLMDKSDVVNILGDFGLVWDYQGESAEEKFFLDWLDKKPWTTVATLGNHENYERIERLPVEEHFGAPVYVVRPSVFLLQSGYVYTINGQKIWNFNGARSHDISDGILDRNAPDFKNKKRFLEKNYRNLWRIRNETWWEQEVEQDPAVYERGIRSLEENDWKVNFIFTHCAPSSVQTLMGFRDVDRLTTYFEEIKQKATYERWLFGHYHKDEWVDMQHRCLYGTIAQLV